VSGFFVIPGLFLVRRRFILRGRKGQEQPAGPSLVQHPDQKCKTRNPAIATLGAECRQCTAGGSLGHLQTVVGEAYTRWCIPCIYTREVPWG